MSREAEFLRRLAQLSAETGVTIHGCGCCDSPYLREDRVKPGVVQGYEASPPDQYSDGGSGNLHWVDEAERPASLRRIFYPATKEEPK